MPEPLPLWWEKSYNTRELTRKIKEGNGPPTTHRHYRYCTAAYRWRYRLPSLVERIPRKVSVVEAPERIVPIAPWERYALVSKTGSGKTTTGTVLASKLVPAERKLAHGWQAWWIDSKGDPKDLERLFRWGFRTDRDSPRRLFIVRYDGKGKTLHEQVEAICEAALKRHGVLVIIDEYVHVVKNQTIAGTQILNVFQRGRGLDVGMIGHTQEPVFIPRQLISQASHILLGDLSYPKDIERANEYYPGYERPPNKHGFYHGAVDFDGDWAYWPNVQSWLGAFKTESLTA